MIDFTIKGERCSGTNYLERLILTNFKGSKNEYPLGWKHSYLNTHNLEINNSDKFLTIIIFRNPMDWLRSFHLDPHHLEGVRGSGLSFSDFIRKEFKQVDNSGEEMFYEKHPFTLESPKNVLELRKWKMENFLNHKKVLSNTYYLKYEDLSSDPEKILNELNEIWFKTEFKFENWNNYKESNDKYTPKKYNDISDEDYDYLMNNIDWVLESKIGYNKVNYIK